MIDERIRFYTFDLISFQVTEKEKCPDFNTVTLELEALVFTYIYSTYIFSRYLYLAKLNLSIFVIFFPCNNLSKEFKPYRIKILKDFKRETTTILPQCKFCSNVFAFARANDATWSECAKEATHLSL